MMRFTMAIGAQSNRVCHGVWAAVGKAMHVMNFEIGATIHLFEEGCRFAATLAGTVRPEEDSSHDIRVAEVDLGRDGDDFGDRVGICKAVGASCRSASKGNGNGGGLLN